MTNTSSAATSRLQPATASAPGKLILCGEHAVVYGRPAIALPLNGIRATARVAPGPAGSGLHFDAPDLGTSWLADTASAHPLDELAHATLKYLAIPAVPDARIQITSAIPIASGMGSSAAIATAVVRALAAAYGRTLAAADVSDLVYASETRYHGTPSGIDNTVIAYEQAIWFERGKQRSAAQSAEPAQQGPLRRLDEVARMEALGYLAMGTTAGPLLEPVEIAEPLMLVIGDTGVRSETRLPVGEVQRRWQADQQAYEYLFNSVDYLVRQVRIALATGDITSLGLLLNENQDVLAEMGVSSPELERLVDAAQAAGAWGAKLSGGGWGGSMLALVDETIVDEVAQALIAAGAAQVLITQVT
jgi:mevalonate kinase